MSSDDNTFFEEVYRLWSQTTEAGSCFWVPERQEEYLDGGPALWFIKAVNHDKEEEAFVGSTHTEEDADFICGIHGAIPDLVRHLMEATDRAERLDEQRDNAEALAADLALENSALRDEVVRLEQEIWRKTL